ncbi:MAG: fibronectin type III domain-containing protein [Candidatus Hydrogenedentes bacterium]|nr:fibronectin type III domain-containing protein [Candidatus Hydrogenedentota bacterium]
MNATRCIAFLLPCFLAMVTAIAEPRHVYLTWQGDTGTTMTVNYQTLKKTRKTEVHYDTVSRGGDPKAYAHHVTGTSHQIPDMMDERLIHVVELQNLKPGGTYYFIAGDPRRGFSKELKFRTIPSGDAPIRFVTGGDMESTSITRKLLTLAAHEDPQFCVIGGDIAYGNGLVGPDIRIAPGRKRASVAWDRWLDNWEELMVTREGYQIPMVLAIGNHEVRGSFNQRPERAPIYRGYFAQEGGRSYFSRTFGENMLLIALDTNHITPYEGAQTDWLRETLAASTHIPYTFALYHVPLYPTFRPYDGPGSVEGRKYWMPLFDEFGLTAAFENHDHVFKRTKLLKGDKVDPDGTLYIGDGCFGQPRRPLSEANHRWYHEKTQSIEHFWVVDVYNERTRYRAIDFEGNELDDVSTPRKR